MVNMCTGRDRSKSMAYKYEKVNKKLLVPQIEDQLMIYIKQDSITIGTKLPNEYDLAERFGVGRSTVREAIKSLASKGVLEVRRGAWNICQKQGYVNGRSFGLIPL